MKRKKPRTLLDLAKRSRTPKRLRDIIARMESPLTIFGKRIDLPMKEAP